MNRRTTLVKTAVYLAAAGTITAGVSACGSSHPAARSGTAATAVKSPATSTAPDLTATGTALKALLPAGADLASAVTVTDAADSGQNWTDPDALPAPALVGADCLVVPQITADEATADYRAAYAQETLAAHGVPIAQIVLAATNPGDAARQIAEVQSLTERCQTFNAPNANGASVGGAVSATEISHLGDQALDVRITATGPDAAKYQQPELILVRVGDKLAVISDAYPDADNGSALKAATVLAARLTGQPV
ncbi:hypothetical protein Caci_4090 [Catenulispora acidiphila DSM 44928]|uniref:PknH-like extracellular domain-containing protein n=1 Tax=Catenulispora acidiphila (strain DSM 44928 / JCM 14897 / NBRC 102108 / NRRL B-24433 / ID139908) TaxID=479433 RepID=C7QGB0_CATAD|nr:hypothetical protein [Catenulispora acidiphila]ACU72955.1 hypothetical protein Caci_4090 [Catenulispora acidiphila DSM 44928]